MRILGIIPARGGSKMVAGKNIRQLAGYPLLAYTGYASAQSALLSHTILSSDDDKIIALARQYNIDAPFIRPGEISTDTATTLSVVQHALLFYQQQKIYFEAVCLLQPTSPFRVEGLIDKCIKKFEETNADTLVTTVVVPHQFNPHWVFEKDGAGLLHLSTGDDVIIPQRQQLPEAFARDGKVYLIKTEIIMRDNNLFGKKISSVETDNKWFVNIDNEADWIKAEEKAVCFLNQYPIE